MYLVVFSDADSFGFLAEFKTSATVTDDKVLYCSWRSNLRD